MPTENEPMMVHHWDDEHGFYRALLFPGWTMARAIEEFVASFGRMPTVRAHKGDCRDPAPLLGIVDRDVAEVADRGGVLRAWRWLERLLLEGSPIASANR